MSFTDVKIKIPWGCEWRHAPEALAEDLGRFEKVSELSLAVRRRRVTFASSPKPGQRLCGWCHTRWGGADGKASIERLCLSPYVEKPFNSKVIKGLVSELRSRYVFFVFRDSYVLCIYVMNILCTLFIYQDIWLCYISMHSHIQTHTHTHTHTHIYIYIYSCKIYLYIYIYNMEDCWSYRNQILW